jgi:hypothetical protein
VEPPAQPQVPVAQVALAPQSCPHMPQLLVFVCKSAQAVPQGVSPSEHVQPPIEHCCALPQALPHCPQLE